MLSELTVGVVWTDGRRVSGCRISEGWGGEAGQSRLVGGRRTADRGGRWEGAVVEVSGGVGGVSFAAEVDEDLSGGCQGVLAGDAGWVQFVGVEVGEAGAEDRFEAGAGVGVREIAGLADKVDEEGELTGCGLAVEQRQGFAGGEGGAGVEVRGDLADGGDEGGVVPDGPDGIDAWRNLVDA